MKEVNVLPFTVELSDACPGLFHTRTISKGKTTGASYDSLVRNNLPIQVMWMKKCGKRIMEDLSNKFTRCALLHPSMVADRRSVKHSCRIVTAHSMHCDTLTMQDNLQETLSLQLLTSCSHIKTTSFSGTKSSQLLSQTSPNFELSLW